MFSPKAKTPRPGGKAAGYDYSQRRCGASDTSRGFRLSESRSELAAAFPMQEVWRKDKKV